MGNPVITHKYTADPAAIEYNGTVYLYTGHDEGENNYLMNDWLVFSSTDMLNWKEHPVPLRATDFAWAKGDAYASQVIERDGKFYWYVAVSHATVPGKAIGVAVSDNPAGPFWDARGSALVTGSGEEDKTNLDPTVMIDTDGQAWLFWGNKRCFYAPLKTNMVEFDGEVKEIFLPDFSEGAWVYKRGDWYYLMYGYSFPEKVAYAMSHSIHGPWEFKGIINEIAGNCLTNSPAVLDFKGNTYFIYHNGGLPEGGSYRRSVCIDYMYYNEDGTIKKIMMTSEGVSVPPL